MTTPRCAGRDYCVQRCAWECTGCGDPLCAVHVYSCGGLEYCEGCCPAAHGDEDFDNE